MSRKTLLITAALLVAGIGFAVWNWRGSDAPPPVTYKLAPVEEGPITSAVSTSGTVQAANSVVVGSQLSGQVLEVLVDYNSSVAKDAVLARIDPSTYESRVRQNSAQLEVAKARVMEQEASVRRAELKLADSQRDFTRRKALRAAGNLSERDFDTAKTTLDTAAVELDLAKAQLANARATVAQQEATLAQAKIDVERTIIRSPIDGIVISREVEPGQTVAASLQAPTLFTIASNLSEMEVEARVDEADIGRVRPEQLVRFSVDAFPGQRFIGRVQQIRKSPKEVQNVVTYTVVVAAPNPGEKLLPGLTAKLDIVIGEKDKTLRVPSQALRFRPRQEAPRQGSGTPVASAGPGTANAATPAAAPQPGAQEGRRPAPAGRVARAACVVPGPVPPGRTARPRAPSMCWRTASPRPCR
ncbi:efflux RND transporter periplasmic adaptor subunit [Aerophototrophica crusticola]|uniref:Efflux RND transporter periplasmic adaptor subunit n=1 Tax=Aerophototrophica crusticola TaxID=1709002 RepID=A0A858R4W2_9PROT|nr:efflux RND transporter periplasmic adaptor subunit [Rhodospirillaceae bacterium B3]